ncbi:uncharacterized protein PGTG_09150 [Puccinia graminis f. sp. tritici CRL 75-36-700-3]|uniref:Uncharacterized protein n=1 Tax=Puccinia graminis f. sp. tritici (strain CRL 75-36-700-3 / race SCCL) TaxID=418459 RepID=E3KFJ7_PUCGT|nr:uncharacterized protein PGTG_09150 [Puccinia graminis f. sp. tritici CRL 75-36-700-3]EFP83197.2 hypothetical protein PGTG_09150 [Puccinia graminis f. sp. tritici CRL 75-36-700-3]
MTTSGGTMLNYGQRNSQDSLSGQPQRGINNMAQGSTTGHIHNPGPHVLDTQFDQSQSANLIIHHVKGLKAYSIILNSAPFGIRLYKIVFGTLKSYQRWSSASNKSTIIFDRGSTIPSFFW